MSSEKGSALALVGDQTVETSTTLQQRVAAIHEAYRSVMREGTHYGVIPGTNKPTLLKPGAEMLCTQFRLVPSFEVTRSDLPAGHREYEVTCTLTKLDTGKVWAQGLGLCSTMESKYRYRWEGKGRDRRKVENPNIADTYNTVLKMAKKRALVDATLTATGCSDMFTQDVEDFAQPSAVEAQQVDVAQPQQPRGASHLQPLRDLFREYQAARGGIDAATAADEIAKLGGASSMSAMTPEQAKVAEAAMRRAIDGGGDASGEPATYEVADEDYTC